MTTIGPTGGKIGIGSWTYPWAVGTIPERRPETPLKPIDLVHRAHALGVGVVQILDNLPMDRLSRAELDELRRAAEDCSVDLQIGTRGVEPDHLRRYLEIACRVGSRLVRTMGGWNGKPAPLPIMEQSLRDVLPDFGDAAVLLALENYEAYRTSDLANLVRAINHPFLGICFDLTNSLGALENIEEILQNLLPLAVNVHLKEFTIERMAHLMGFAFTGRPTGQGRLPLDRIFAELRRLDRRPDVIIELWTPFSQSLSETLTLEESWAKQSVTYLKGLPRFEDIVS